RAGRPVHELAGLPAPGPRVTAYTISLDAPDAMAAAAAKASARPLLKVKLGHAGDPARIRAVRGAAPRAELIVDANEGWTGQNLTENLAACVAAGVTLIEQPLPAGAARRAARPRRRSRRGAAARARPCARLALRRGASSPSVNGTLGLTKLPAGAPFVRHQRATTAAVASFLRP